MKDRPSVRAVSRATLLAAAIVASGCGDDQTPRGEPIDFGTADVARDTDRDEGDATEDAADAGADASDADDAGGDLADATPDADLPPDMLVTQVLPLAPDSPWPKFRADGAQTGVAPIEPTDDGSAPWVFETGKGIFSSPVIAADGTIYIGSADRNFYAISRDGEELWRVETGEIIDSSALLDDLGRVYFGSGDGNLYALDAETGDEVWTFTADEPTGAALINWFEGNVGITPDGTLIAGNDNFRLYGIDRDTGERVWRANMPDQTWSLPAIDLRRGRMVVGNNNLLGLGSNVIAFDLEGNQLWGSRGTATVAASPVITFFEVAYVGAFDGYLRGYDTRTGDIIWEFPTNDHIYASPALHPDTEDLIQPSADGTVYSISDEGEARWAFDWGSPIRSSPVIDGNGIIYMGTGDGHLLVLNPDGTLRWALRLIDEDRDDLNASPAIGEHAVYLAGESGEVFSVPIDFCLRSEELDNPDCVFGPSERLPDEGVFLRYTTGFGTALAEAPAGIHRNQPLAFTLEVRADDETVLALIDAASLEVTVTPDVPVDAEVSANRRFVTVVPASPGGYFEGDESGEVSVRLAGRYLVDPDRDGLAMSGGTDAGGFDETFTFALTPAPEEPFAPTVPAEPGDDASVWELSRLAAPLPTLLPSYNQIGFDSLHFLVGLVGESPTGAIGWLVSAAPGADGVVRAIPGTRGMFPFEVSYEDGQITFVNQGGLALEVMSAVIAFDSFRVSALLGADGAGVGAASVHAAVECGNIEPYGTFLRALGMCNPDSDILTAFGATLLTPWEGGVQSAPTGVGEPTFGLTEIEASVILSGSSLALDEHAFALLLVDEATGRPINLDYGPNLRSFGNGGVLEGVTLPVDRDALPDQVRLYLLVDTYPAAQELITIR
jgi:outer membrane protein assembly factor BamB